MAQGEHAERAPLLWGASTDVGPVRSHNEDSWLAVSPVFAVADGMGGHLGGARASSQAVLTLQEFLSPDRLGDRPVDLVDLSVAIDAAATAVASLAPADNPMSAPGTTLSGLMVLWTAEGAYWLSFNVGDSRAYVVGAGAAGGSRSGGDLRRAPGHSSSQRRDQGAGCRTNRKCESRLHHHADGGRRPRGHLYRRRARRPTGFADPGHCRCWQWAAGDR